MIKFFLGLIIGICLVLASGYLFVVRGGIPMSTKSAPLPMERMLAHKALAASIGRSAEDKSPIPADETNLLAGAHVYLENGCASCHGRLGQSNREGSKRFYPHIPPLLPPSKGVTDDEVGETHWVVKNGIRFSAMPSFESKLTDTQIWQVSLLLRNADKLPASLQALLTK
jgi:thiosulfate dehydrogenase